MFLKFWIFAFGLFVVFLGTVPELWPGSWEKLRRPCIIAGIIAACGVGVLQLVDSYRSDVAELAASQQRHQTHKVITVAADAIDRSSTSVNATKDIVTEIKTSANNIAEEQSELIIEVKRVREESAELRRMLSELVKRAEISTSPDSEVKKAIEELIDENRELLNLKYPYGYGIAYADGERYLSKSSKIGPVDIDWHGFFLRRFGDTYQIKLPRISTPFLTMDGATASGDFDWLANFTVIDTPEYRLGVEIAEAGERGVAIILGVEPRKKVREVR